MNIPKGLAGVEVDDTAISLVDGSNGGLYYRGYAIDDLATRRFTDVAALVLSGQLAESSLAAELCAHGELTPRDTQLLLAADDGRHPMHVLQGLVALLDVPDDAFDEYGEAGPGLVIAAKLPQCVAHLANGAGTAYPATNDYCGRFLEQLAGEHSALAQEAFEVTQILQIEHGFNAGTFTARVVASTLAPVTDAVSAALGALHGPLHGGADQAALEMADEVGDPARAHAFVDAALAKGVKIMGMGHREYRVLDPRAKHVKQYARELCSHTPMEATFETLVAMEARFNERMAERGKRVHANLEFYKGLVYRAIGLPNELFTPAFAMARVFGYVAHFIESRRDNRIMRPAARYVGPDPSSVSPP